MRRFDIPKTPVSSTKSIRFPNDLIEQVEQAIRGTDCTFSAFVVEAVRWALEDIDDQKQDKEGDASCSKT